MTNQDWPKLDPRLVVKAIADSSKRDEFHEAMDAIAQSSGSIHIPSGGFVGHVVIPNMR